MRMTQIAATMLSLAWCVIASAQSTTFKYVAINYPNSSSTVANGINNYNAIVGSYQTSSGGVHGFKLRSGNFSRYDVPGAVKTVIQGISDTGDMVGWYTTPSQVTRGFLYHAGKYTTIDVPGNGSGTYPMGINKSGTVVGRWLDAGGNYHGFLWVQDKITKYDLNGGVTSLNGISNPGIIAGQNLNLDFWRAFLKKGSDVDYLFRAAYSDTEAYGINGRADVVGCFNSYATGFIVYHVESNEGSEPSEQMHKPILLRFPGALQTCATGINYNRAVVGSFTDGRQHQHGFLAVPQ